MKNTPSPCPPPYTLGRRRLRRLYAQRLGPLQTQILDPALATAVVADVCQCITSVVAAYHK